jgi:uroporphyrinogen-III decarboxylase
MNAKERLEAALLGKPVDHIPFSPFLAYVWESFPEKIQSAGQLAFHHMIGSDPLWRGAPCPVKAIQPDGIERKTFEENNRLVTQVTTPVGSFRFAYAKSESGHTDFVVEHPLKTEEDYKVRMWIEEHTRYESNMDAVQAHFDGDGKEGLSIGQLIPRCKSAYQDMVEFFAGTEELIYAQIDFPDTVKSLWEMMVQNDLRAVNMSLESPYAYFLTWEDSSTQNYSPAQYDEFIGSEIGQWCDLLAGAGKRYVQHACGHVEALIERMRDHGTFAIESISPPPTGNLTIKDARTKIGNTMAIIGGIEPTQFLNLSESDLVSYTESVVADANGGGFILANSDSCPPGVTIEKFKLVADIAKTMR